MVAVIMGYKDDVCFLGGFDRFSVFSQVDVDDCVFGFYLEAGVTQPSDVNCHFGHDCIY